MPADTPSRRGRPRLPADRKKTCEITAYVSKREREALADLASRSRYSVSELVRHACRKILLQSYYSSMSSA